MELKYALVTEDDEGDNCGIMISIGAYDRSGIAVVDDNNDHIFLKDDTYDTIVLTIRFDSFI